jgi:multiple sugar transport system substrate-binding protein
MSRALKRKVFFLVPAIAASLFFLCAAGAAAGDFDWRKFEGTSLRVMTSKSAFTPVVEKQIEEFEQLTGIEVRAEHYPSAPLRRKIIMELGARNKDLDVFQGMGKTTFQYNEAGWLEPLGPYLQDPALTNPDYDYEDFFETTRLKIDGKIVGISTTCNPQVLIYRKDLLEKHGLEVPANWDELEAAAKKLKADLEPGTYAWIARMNNENTAPFSSFLHSNNARWIDEQGKPAFNSPEGVEALDFYGRMAREYGPPGAATIGWKEVVGAIAQGKAAMTVEISIFATLILENPKKSKVAGKLGYALVPPGVPGNYETMLPLNTLHVNALSEKKEAAWYYVQFMSGKEASLTIQKLGLPSTRRSSWGSPEWKAENRLPELAEIQIRGIRTGKRFFEIPIAQFTEARPVLSRLIFSVYEGADAKEKADEAAAEISRIMQE